MKKLITLFSLIFAISCSHQNQKVVLNFKIDNDKTVINSQKTFTLRVSDERHSKKVLGSKKFGTTKVNVFTEDNLSEILSNQIKNSLVNKGLIEGNDKIIEVRIKTLKYKAKRGFPVGNSEAKAVIRVDVKDNKGKNKEFSKNYTLEFKNKHFISSFATTDEKNINNLLEELVSNMMQDKELLDNIAQ